MPATTATPRSTTRRTAQPGADRRRSGARPATARAAREGVGDPVDLVERRARGTAAGSAPATPGRRPWPGRRARCRRGRRTSRRCAGAGSARWWRSPWAVRCVGHRLAVGALGQQHGRQMVGAGRVELSRGTNREPGRRRPARRGSGSRATRRRPCMSSKRSNCERARAASTSGRLPLMPGMTQVVGAALPGSVAGPGVAAQPVQAVRAGEVGQLGVVGDERPALGRGEVLGGVERQAGPGACPDR